MTQVINGYLQWSFEHVEIQVIESRGNPGDHVASVIGLIRGICKVLVIRLRREPALLVAHLSEGGAFWREGMLARLGHALGIPVVAHMHGSEFSGYAQAHPALVGKVLRCATSIVCLTEETHEICARCIGIQRVELIPNAVYPGAPTQKTKTVIFGGLVCHRKGVDVLLEAWKRIAPDPAWRLIIAGPIQMGEHFNQTIPGIEFVGNLDHDELMARLASASVAVLPSRHEAMPMFILEAMAHRACVISTRVGGIPILLSDDSGILINPESVDGLASALQDVLTDDARREAIATRGWVRFGERFSAQAIFPRVESIWLNALNGAPLATQTGS